MFHNERNFVVYKGQMVYSLVTGIFEYAVVWVYN